MFNGYEAVNEYMSVLKFGTGLVLFSYLNMFSKGCGCVVL